MTNAKSEVPTIPLPSGWNETVRSAVLHVISLAQFAAARTRGWAADSLNAHIRLKAENDRLAEEVTLLREEIRIKDARMARIDACRRPQYPPVERMAILELKAARSWSLEQAARTFLVTAATVASWLRRVDESGAAALVQLPRPPVNKFPEFVSHVVRRRKTLSPSLGKVKIAQMLARTGLHLGATTVGRMLKGESGHAAVGAEPESGPVAGSDAPAEPATARVVTAKRPNHVWHVDLTAVPTAAGFCTTWLPFALPQCWPFCWWAAVAIDHFSRRVMGVAVFAKQPPSVAVRAFLGRAIAKAKRAPKYIICDRGSQFACQGFRDWCGRKGIQPPRYGAIGKRGSIAVVERFILTLKCLLSGALLVSYRRQTFRRELNIMIEWYNAHRPHTWLRGRTPDEVYHGRYPANRRPRFEPRPWPRGSPCATPWALIRGKPGAGLELQVSFHKGRKSLPIVALTRAA